MSPPWSVGANTPYRPASASMSKWDAGTCTGPVDRDRRRLEDLVGQAHRGPHHGPHRRGGHRTFAATRAAACSYSSLGCIAAAIRRWGSACAGRFCRSSVRPSTNWA